VRSNSSGLLVVTNLGTRPIRQMCLPDVAECAQPQPSDPSSQKPVWPIYSYPQRTKIFQLPTPPQRSMVAVSTSTSHKPRARSI